MENSATAPFLTIAHAVLGLDADDIITSFNEKSILSDNIIGDIKTSVMGEQICYGDGTTYGMGRAR